MILMFGRIRDPIVAHLAVHLAARSADLVLVEPSDASNVPRVQWQGDQHGLDGVVTIGERSLEARAIRSMYVREIGGGAVRRPASGADVGSRALAESLWALTDAYRGLVVNRRMASCTNASKPYQLDMIRRQGFRVPHTMVTTRPDAARAFWEEFRGEVIYKSLSSERSIVKPMTRADLSRLELVRSCPVQLQERIPGVDIRVHVVGARVFATEIRSHAADYRYAELDGASREMRPIQLPEHVASRCVGLTKALGLVVAGVDLRRTLEGDYCCFEANPSPAFLWFEDITGQRIGAAIADLLCEGAVWN